MHGTLTHDGSYRRPGAFSYLTPEYPAAYFRVVIDKVPSFWELKSLHIEQCCSVNKKLLRRKVTTPEMVMSRYCSNTTFAKMDIKRPKVYLYFQGNVVI